MAGAKKSPDLDPAYLISGTDEAKIDATVARLRARAVAEAGEGALEVFASQAGTGPDAEALVAAIPAMSLIGARRYLLADGVERWSAKQVELAADALAGLPPDTTVVLVAREDQSAKPPRRVSKKLAAAVEKAGGSVHAFNAPKARDLPAWLRKEASARGFGLDPAAASLLVERLGESTTRLSTELDRLAVWADPGAVVTRDDLAGMVADSSEEVSWALSDAIVDRNPAAAVAACERLAGQGEGVTPLIYGVARRLREAAAAVAMLEEGRSPKDVESRLPMHPYAAKMLVRRVQKRSAGEIRAATCAVADLEYWTRGGADYPEPVALTLAIRRAAGARE